jgi:hypothetical protein
VEGPESLDRMVVLDGCLDVAPEFGTKGTKEDYLHLKGRNRTSPRPHYMGNPEPEWNSNSSRSSLLYNVFLGPEL